MSNNITDALAELEYRLPLSNLRSMQVEVSSACNLHCSHCFNHIPGHVTAFMKKELWDAKVKPYLGQLSDIHLVGIGEPLLNCRFFDYVQDSREAGARVHTTSNLQLVTDDIAERLVTSGLYALSFSCDGASPETYEAIRRGGRLEQLEAALAAILQARQRHNSPTPSLCLNFGATLKNIRELPAVLLLSKRYQVDTVIAYHNVVYLAANRDDSLFHHQSLSDRYFTQAVAFCCDNGIAFLYPGLFRQPLHTRASKIYCGYPFQHLYVYSDGRVGPCCSDFPDRYMLGDLRQLTLPEVWNSDQVRALRREMCDNPSYTCRYCVSHLKMDISDPHYLFRFPGANDYIAGLTPVNACGECLP